MMLIERLNDILRPFQIVARVSIYIAVAMVAFLALDREPPFVIPSLHPVTVKAGEWAMIDVPVQRDLSRHCDATYSRYLFDSSGARFDLSAQQEASDAMIREMDAAAPGRLHLKVLIPDAGPKGMELGPAYLVTSLSYACNAVHSLWPIKVKTVIPLQVVP